MTSAPVQDSKGTRAVRRCTGPQTADEAAFEGAVRVMLQTRGWSAGQRGHLLDVLLMVDRAPDIFAAAVPA